MSVTTDINYYKLYLTPKKLFELYNSNCKYILLLLLFLLLLLLLLLLLFISCTFYFNFRKKTSILSSNLIYLIYFCENITIISVKVLQKIQTIKVAIHRKIQATTVAIQVSSSVIRFKLNIIFTPALLCSR